MLHLDKTLMIELADTLTRVGMEVSRDSMRAALPSDTDPDTTSQVLSGRVKPVWMVDFAHNYWYPASPDIWKLPYHGFVGTAVGLYQPIPYLLAWMGNHKLWMDMYLKGEDLFSIIADDLSMGREQGREAFYRYVYGLSEPSVEIRYPWLAALREGMRERAASAGYVETGFGTRLTVKRLELALANYLDQVIRDVLRLGTLQLFREFGYVPCGIFPDSVIVPNQVGHTYAEAFQKAANDRFSFSVVMERLGSQ